MIVAILFYATASVVAIALEQRLLQASAEDLTLAWLNQHVYTPMLRTLVLAGFIVLAYPQLLGLPQGPALSDLLRDGHGDALITTLFVASLALPLVPVVSALPGAVLACQGILGCCLLTAWVAEAAGLPAVRYWMGLLIAVEVLAVLLAGRMAARALLRWWPRRVDSRIAVIVSEVTRMASALPAIALYGWALGRQLQGAAAG